MDNSFITMQNITIEMDEPVDNTERLSLREQELVKLIESLQLVIKSPEWKWLEANLWNGVVGSILRLRDNEVEKKPLNGPMIHSLNGQLAWAKKYANLSHLVDIYRQELEGIRKALKNAN